MRIVLIGAGLLVLSAAQRPALSARFIGNMAFAITDGQTTLMTDFPYESGYSVYMEYPASEIRSSTAATLSLITHRHGDHWAPALFAKTGWTVAGPDDVIAGLPANRVLPLGDTASFGPIQIQRFRTPHAGIGHHSYVVTWHGRQLYFIGDTEQGDTLLASRNLDVAFVSPWVFRSLAKKGLTPDAQRVVIYHHQAGEQVPECRDRCVIPKQGETLRID